jgi:DhnA family fructose-bisphosphate aldolase class Ia
MSDYGKQIRLNRILRGGSRKALVVAFDHALFHGPIAGTIDPAKQVKAFADGGADAILLNRGLVGIAYQGLLNAQAPSLIMRLDWSSAWTALVSGGALRSNVLVHPEEALQAGADAALTFLIIGTGDLEFEAGEIARNAELARECEKVGLPLIVETLARGKMVDNPTSPEWIKRHTRFAVELGADVLKTEYTGDVETMKDVVEGTPAPLLVLGGARKSGDDGLDTVRGAVASGAAGVFFGRNVFQAPDIPAFLGDIRAGLNGK